MSGIVTSLHMATTWYLKCDSWEKTAIELKLQYCDNARESYLVLLPADVDVDMAVQQ